MFTLKPKELPMMGLDLIFEPQAPWIINEAHGELKHTDRQIKFKRGPKPIRSF